MDKHELLSIRQSIEDLLYRRNGLNIHRPKKTPYKNHNRYMLRVITKLESAGATRMIKRILGKVYLEADKKIRLIHGRSYKIPKYNPVDLYSDKNLMSIFLDITAHVHVCEIPKAEFKKGMTIEESYNIVRDKFATGEFSIYRSWSRFVDNHSMLLYGDQHTKEFLLGLLRREETKCITEN